MVTQVKVGHIGILVSELEESRRFYEKIFGFEVHNQLPPPGNKAKTYFLGNDQFHHLVVITQASGGIDVPAVAQANRQVQQVAFELPDESAFETALAHLQANGVQITEGPLRHSDQGSSDSLSAYFQDPDGYRLEFFVEAKNVPESLRDKYAAATH